MLARLRILAHAKTIASAVKVAELVHAPVKIANVAIAVSRKPVAAETTASAVKVATVEPVLAKNANVAVAARNRKTA